MVDDKASSIEEGIEIAREAIDSKKGINHLGKNYRSFLRRYNGTKRN